MSATSQNFRPPSGRTTADGPVLTRSPLSRDLIVDSALRLAKQHGMAAVSMRRLAKELGVQPMSLYYHLPSRAVLMVLMAERSLAAVLAADAPADWDDRVLSLMLGLYRAGVDDPAVFPVLASEALGTRMMPRTPLPAGAASVRLIERVEQVLLEAGVPKSDRSGSCRALIALVVGFLVGQVDGLVPTGGESSPESSSDDDGDGRDDGGGSAGGEPPPPELTALHDNDPATDLADALRTFVQGLRAQAAG